MSDAASIESALAAIPAPLGAALEAAGYSSALLAELLATHRRLWALEDRARSQRASAQAIADVKREIDRENGARHALIDRIEGSRTPTAAAAPDVVRYSETAAETCDRLLILSLKIRACGELAADEELDAERRAECAKKRDRLARWRDHLVSCVLDLLADLAANRALLPPRAEAKLYNDPVLNPVTREEGRAGKPR